VELFTEGKMWGLLKLDRALAETFIWRMGLTQRWTMIVTEAKKRLGEDEWKEAKRIRSMVDDVSQDRNVIVHGIIHKTVRTDLTLSPPVWAIFMGQNAGKSFPVSTDAVRVVIKNAYKLQLTIKDFNTRNGFSGHSLDNLPSIGEPWPRQL